MTDPKETPDLVLFVRMMKKTGLWFHDDRSFRHFKLIQYGRLMIYLMTVLFWDCSLSLIGLNDIPRKSYTPMVIWSNFHFLTVTIFFFKADDLVEFTKGMSRLLKKRVNLWEKELFERMTSRTWKYINYSFGHVFIITLVVSFLSTIIDIFFIVFSDSEEPFYIPIVLEGFISGKMSRSVTFYALNIINGLLVIIPSVYYVALLTALPATVTYIYYELEVFQKKLSDWSLDSNNENEAKRAAVFNEIVSDHSELLRLIDIIKGLLGSSFSIQNFISSINTGFLLHAAKKAFNEGDIMLITQQMYFFMQLIGVTFLCCYIGEILHHQGNTVSEHLYKISWYTEKPKVRKDILMVLIATQRPIVFDLKNKVPLNLETFGEVMNRAYTLFVLLESVQ